VRQVTGKLMTYISTSEHAHKARGFKRMFDIIFALVLLVVAVPIMSILFISVILKDGRPFIYSDRRAKSFNQEFNLYKIRTMSTAPAEANSGVSGGDKNNRISPLGHILRRTRLDELPQLINVLRGDISFVGPRPPAPEYVRRFPDVYAAVLQNKPGITGLASVMYHAHEEMILRNTATATETDQVYVRRAIPRKASLDLLYQKNQSVTLDIYISSI
jgi:lipopolysaccharide/colanic/teichoic acid biosynthesis glycosyltransferase